MIAGATALGSFLFLIIITFRHLQGLHDPKSFCIPRTQKGNEISDLDAEDILCGISMGLRNRGIFFCNKARRLKPTGFRAPGKEEADGVGIARRPRLQTQDKPPTR
jgi:hypothetical protein